ncbi:unnamed protein product [Prorocentrum cordatum]|uniref:RRM domain-containing protein n=1 Tax=Prorocentrum cordatum TaxID=2364126 RepID=A0ABN9SEB3_9DINO|nr:unnamed protein product [Polarella glacialis]
MAPVSPFKFVLLMAAAHGASGISLREVVKEVMDDLAVDATVDPAGVANPLNPYTRKATSRIAANSSDVPAQISAAVDATAPGNSMKFQSDVTMAAALLGTPLVLYLLRTDALRQPSLAVILVVTGLYIFASLAMNVLNKKAAKAFEATCLLVIIQMLVSVVVIICMEYDKMKMDKWADFMKWLVVPFAFAGMLGTSMFAFKEASLTTILIMRNILPILTFGFEKALFNQPESMCWKVVTSLVVTLAGSVLYGFVDISATNLGKLLILVNCAFTIVDRLVQAKLLKGNKDFSISISMCMLLNNGLGVVPMLALALAKGEVPEGNAWFLVMMSGLCGASLGYVGLRTQQLVSGTTVLVMQNFNKLLIIALGMFVFHEHLTPMSFLGCFVSLLGCFGYGYLRLPSEAKAPGEAPRHGDTSNEALVAGTLPARRAVATPHLEAACRSALSGGGLCGFTTVRLKNVDLALTPNRLARMLISHGFKDSFDLVYIPLDMVNKTKNRSLAFVNFVDPAAAECAYLKFHNQEMPPELGVCKNGKRLEITPAHVQGFQENIAWNSDAVVAGQNCHPAAQRAPPPARPPSHARPRQCCPAAPDIAPAAPPPTYPRLAATRASRAAPASPPPAFVGDGRSSVDMQAAADRAVEVTGRRLTPSELPDAVKVDMHFRRAWRVSQPLPEHIAKLVHFADGRADEEQRAAFSHEVRIASRQYNIDPDALPTPEGFAAGCRAPIGGRGQTQHRRPKRGRKRSKDGKDKGKKTEASEAEPAKEKVPATEDAEEAAADDAAADPDRSQGVVAGLWVARSTPGRRQALLASCCVATVTFAFRSVAAVAIGIVIAEEWFSLLAQAGVAPGAPLPLAHGGDKAPSKTFSKGWSEPYGAKGKDPWGGGKDAWGGGKDAWGGGYGGKGKDTWGAGKDSWSAGKDSYGKGKGPMQSAVSKGKGDKGKDGKDGKGKRGKGHLLPRTRISAEKFQGTVSAWKGKFGWITPAEEIEHEKAKLHKGGLFVSMDDLEGVTKLTEGATVEFHIWEDATGLGAEEVVQF